MVKGNGSHYKKDRLCTSSQLAGAGEHPWGGGQQPLDPPHRGAMVPIVGLPPSGCTGGEWGYTVGNRSQSR